MGKKKNVHGPIEQYKFGNSIENFRAFSFESIEGVSLDGVVINDVIQCKKLNHKNMKIIRENVKFECSDKNTGEKLKSIKLRFSRKMSKEEHLYMKESTHAKVANLGRNEDWVKTLAFQTEVGIIHLLVHTAPLYWHGYFDVDRELYIFEEFAFLYPGARVLGVRSHYRSFGVDCDAFGLGINVDENAKGVADCKVDVAHVKQLCRVESLDNEASEPLWQQYLEEHRGVCDSGEDQNVNDDNSGDPYGTDNDEDVFDYDNNEDVKELEDVADDISNTWDHFSDDSENTDASPSPTLSPSPIVTHKTPPTLPLSPAPTTTSPHTNEKTKNLKHFHFTFENLIININNVIETKLVFVESLNRFKTTGSINYSFAFLLQYIFEHTKFKVLCVSECPESMSPPDNDTLLLYYHWGDISKVGRIKWRRSKDHNEVITYGLYKALVGTMAESFSVDNPPNRHLKTGELQLLYWGAEFLSFVLSKNDHAGKEYDQVKDKVDKEKKKEKRKEKKKNTSVPKHQRTPDGGSGEGSRGRKGKDGDGRRKGKDGDGRIDGGGKKEESSARRRSKRNNRNSDDSRGHGRKRSCLSGCSILSNANLFSSKESSTCKKRRHLDAEARPYKRTCYDNESIDVQKKSSMADMRLSKTSLDDAFQAPCHADGILLNGHQFYKWLTELESAMKSEMEEKYCQYVSTLTENLRTCDEILQQVDNTLNLSDEHQAQHHVVVTKTKTMHDACERLVMEKERLIEFAGVLRNKLNYFDEVSTQFYPTSISVGSDQFLPLLKCFDECISYVASNPQYADSGVYLVKFRQLQSRAFGMVRSLVQSTLKNASSQVQMALKKNASGNTVISEGLETSILYVRFKAAVNEMKPVMIEIEGRSSKKEYSQVLADCHKLFCEQRLSLVCQLEHRLFDHFFPSSSAEISNLASLMDPLCSLLYDTLYPKFIHEAGLDLLCELVNILKTEILEEQLVRQGDSVAGLRSIVLRILADAREHLIFRAQIYVRDERRISIIPES